MVQMNIDTEGLRIGSLLWYAAEDQWYVIRRIEPGTVHAEPKFPQLTPSKPMTTPTTYTPTQIKELASSVSVQLPSGRYVPARPLGWGGISLGMRFKAAWAVFTGKCDVLKWDEQ